MRQGLAPYDTPFARFTRNNGILAEDVDALTVSRVRFRQIAGFAVLVSRSRNVTISAVEVRDSGSRNEAGHNNATGGILIEEGSSGFRVTGSDLRRIRGNGIWTHSLYTSPRNARGLFRGNHFEDIGRDALQAGHATEIRIEENWGSRIGYPAGDVDAIPVAIDTAGNVDRSAYTGNRFENINGKCIDLDGFHDGEVRGNVCRGMANYGVVMNNTNPDMRSQNIRVVENVIDAARYGGIFVIGTGHLVARNRMTNLNTAHCGCYFQAGEPDLLAAGVYLGKGAEQARRRRAGTRSRKRDQRLRDGRQVRGERTWRGSERGPRGTVVPLTSFLTAGLRWLFRSGGRGRPGSRPDRYRRRRRAGRRSSPCSRPWRCRRLLPECAAPSRRAA